MAAAEKSAKALRIDPLLVAIIGKKFEAISRDMALVLARTCRSLLLQNGDFSTGLLDVRRRILTQEEGLPLMAYGYSSMLDALCTLFEDEIAPGDVFLHNDPYAGNNQAQDTAVFKPVFVGGELRWWAAAKGHLADWGGTRLGGYNPDAVDVWQETIRIPPLKVFERGRLRRDVWSLLMANTRLPGLVEGDLRAMIAACNIGEARLLELHERYEGEILQTHVEELLERTARRTRNEILQIPDGTHTAESSWTLPEESGGGALVARLTITVDGGRMVFDFTGSDQQAPRYYNSPYATTYAAVMATLLMLFDPLIPHNEGVERCIEIVVPEGIFLNPRFPAPTVMGNFVANDVVSEVIIKALSEPLSERVTAGWGRGLNANFGGTTDSGESFFGLPLLTNKNGGGGTDGCDGWSAIGLFTCGGAFAFDDYEAFEAAFPVRLLCHELWPESAGAGQYRGGFGAYTKYRVEYPSVLTTFGDGTDEPFGLFGGTRGRPNDFIVTTADGARTWVPPNGTVMMPACSIVEAHNAGGGGFGPAHRRPVELVVADVLNELISRSTAKNVYGVRFRGDGLDVDEEATAKLRERLAVQQASPSAGTDE
jgi:N-methylhydantoinase B